MNGNRGAIPSEYSRTQARDATASVGARSGCVLFSALGVLEVKAWLRALGIGSLFVEAA